MTRKPCPNCGRTYQRENDKVCGECQKWIAEAEKIIAKIKSEPYLEAYLPPRYEYNLPYIPHVTYHQGSPDKDYNKAFFKLIGLLSYPHNQTGSERGKIMIEKPPNYSNNNDVGGTVLMDIEIRELLNTIHNKVIEIATAAFEEGKRQGSSLLIQLARGEVSIEKFNEQTIQKEKLPKRENIEKQPKPNY